MTLMDEILKNLNKAVELEQKAKLYHSLLTILAVLGIKPEIEPVSDEDIKHYLLWQQAREEKDYEHADIHRKALQAKGWI